MPMSVLTQICGCKGKVGRETDVEREREHGGTGRGQRAGNEERKKERKKESKKEAGGSSKVKLQV